MNKGNDMNFRNGIVVFGLFALLITACESKEEKFLRELENSYKDFGKDFEKEMKDFGKDFEKEMKKFERELEDLDIPNFNP